MNKRGKFDQILKKLFTLSNRMIIDFINGLYDENIAYSAEIIFSGPEYVKNNLDIIRSDLFIIIDDKDNNFHGRYQIEFQTLTDKKMVIRCFEYGFHSAIDTINYEENNITIKFPEQRVIFLEENNNIPDTLKLRIILHDKTIILYEVPAMKMWKYNSWDLKKSGMYLLLPFQVFKLRKSLDAISKKDIAEDEKIKLIKNEYEKLKEIIHEILITSDELLDGEIITLEDYNEIAMASANLSDYLYERYGNYEEVDAEVKEMVKTFYDPKIYNKGIREGIREGEAIGEKKGLLNGIFEGFEVALEIKFGEDGLNLMTKIRKINDLIKLKALKEVIKEAKSIEEIEEKL